MVFQGSQRCLGSLSAGSSCHATVREVGCMKLVRLNSINCLHSSHTTKYILRYMLGIENDLLVNRC
jgi:hypothetical protein